MTRRHFLPWLLGLFLSVLPFKVRQHDREYEQNGRMYFRHGQRTFVVWPDGNGPLTDGERERARQMAKDYFNLKVR